MARAKTSQKKKLSEKKTCDYKVGDRIFEGEYTAGTIVCEMDHPSDRTLRYFLLRDDQSRYTIYSAEKYMVCRPTLSRMIPEIVIQRMFLQAFYGVDVPPPKVMKELKRIAVT